MSICTSRGSRPLTILALIISLFYLTAIEIALGAPLPADPATVERGRAIFEQNCMTCHGANAAGGFGPPLKPLSARKDKRPVVEIIKAPGPNMPPLYPATLTITDISDVAAFLESIQ